jgi:ribose/xylose/arabinose/galactoside ABC-type transport system permease subunit
MALSKQAGKNVLRREAGAFMEKYAIYLALLLLCVVLAIITDKFLTIQNFKLILNQISINGIMAIGVTFVLITAGIDISIGSVVGFAGVVAALTAPAGSSIPMVIPFLAALGCGFAAGAINGLLVTKGRLAPYIVTLGMMTIMRGLSLIVSGGRPVSRLIGDFGFLGNNSLFSIPLPIYIYAIVAVVTHVILTHLKIGRYVYAVGGNTNAAYASGISPDLIRFFVHVVSGTLAGLAGIILASRINTGHPNSGSGYELDAIAAAVVGGTSLAGGTGGIPGTVVGALIIGVLGNGLDLLAVSSYWQQVVKGLIIIASVLIDRNKKRQ